MYDFLASQDFYARIKIDTSVLKQLIASGICPIDTLIRILMLQFSREELLKSRKFNTNQSFWDNLNVDMTERFDGAHVLSEKKGFSEG